MSKPSIWFACESNWLSDKASLFYVSRGFDVGDSLKLQRAQPVTLCGILVDREKNSDTQWAQAERAERRRSLVLGLTPEVGD
jgi:hypothetical protein